MNIRKYMFWLLDSLRGSKIGRHYRDIAAIFEDDGSVMQDKSTEYRDAIFSYAKSKVPFYRQMADVERFENLPLIDKSIVKNNFEQFHSVEFLGAKLHTMSTSGSTCTPFTVHQDSNKRRRVLAEILFFNRRVGYEVGHHLAYYRAITKESAKPWWLQKLQNESLIDTADLGEDFLCHTAEKLERFPANTLLYGYASSMDVIGRHIYQSVLPEARKKYKISSIITIAEAISDQGRKILETIFQCPVVSRYSNQEMGILAQQIPNDDFFVLNRASYHFEIFDMEKDVPVPHGRLGRIVITDLFNRAMPLLRYNTGDTGIIEKRDLNGISTDVLTTIEGRQLDYIRDTQGKLLSPAFVTTMMWNYQEILQFQFIQKNARDYLFRLNTGGKQFDREKDLIYRLQKVLGEDANIAIEAINEIPVLASGKRKYIINEYSASL